MANERTDARRARVRELFGKSDKRIAEILIEEGFFPSRRTKEGRIQQLDSARRRVYDDRQWWREQWKSEKRLTRDRSVSTEEYIAKLETRIADLEEILDDPRTKGTPRVQSLSEIRQLEQAIAKALGIDAAERDDGDGEGNGNTFTTLILDVSACSPETKGKLLHGK